LGSETGPIQSNRDWRARVNAAERSVHYVPSNWIVKSIKLSIDQATATPRLAIVAKS